MAQREKQAGKRTASDPADAPPSGSAKTAARGPTAPGARGRLTPVSDRPAKTDRVSQLEQERDQLKATLEAAAVRIAALEHAQAQVANRIGWIIDALQTLKEDTR